MWQVLLKLVGCDRKHGPTQVKIFKSDTTRVRHVPSKYGTGRGRLLQGIQLKKYCMLYTAYADCEASTSFPAGSANTVSSDETCVGSVVGAHPPKFAVNKFKDKLERQDIYSNRRNRIELDAQIGRVEAALGLMGLSLLVLLGGSRSLWAQILFRVEWRLRLLVVALCGKHIVGGVRANADQR